MSYGDIPHVVNGLESGYGEIFAYDSGKSALVYPNASIMAGFGVLKAGQAIALNGSAAGNYGKFMPYNPESTADGATLAPARIRILQDGADGTSVYVDLDASYALAVGDDLYAIDSNTTAQDLGAITAIDRTTYYYARMALITTTSNLPSTIAVSTFGYVVVEGYDVCKGILTASVNTGWGENAKGAVAPILLKNAILNTGMLTNVDSAARTDLSASTLGQYTYL
ncbi:MAG: hypothetical protein ABIH23_26810 [bacterium]